MKWITALNLQQWADTIPARVIFPGMVADLIRASAARISNIRFPNGDKGQVRGFDGTLSADGVAPYVPDGESIWEFGVAGGAQAKAEGDYKKRTREMTAEAKKNTTFVFVSPRTWDNPKVKLPDWIEARTNKEEWKDVVYIDGAMLEDWFALCPAVAARYAKYELKLTSVTGVRSTDEYWDEFSARFAPPLVEAVLLAGRKSQAESLLQRMSEGGEKLLYAADSPDEVIAFAIAAIRGAEPETRLFWEARTLVVDTEEGARAVANKSGLVFLPRAQGRGLTGILAKAGPTIVSAGADEKRSSHEVLNRPLSSELAKAFTKMGFTEAEGYEIARRSGRSLAVLARLQPSGTAANPEWLGSGEVLLPALLAGAWQASVAADTAILCVLGLAENYEKIESPLRALAKLQDPPIERVGDVWAMRASVDAFVYMGHLIGHEHLAQFATAAKKVFSQVTAIPKADEIFKVKAERSDAHSNWLKDGMMNTLLHMAVLHEQADFKVTGSTPQDFVNGIVRELPGLSKDHRLLASLQDQIALLAEAAPIPFLEALERLLEGDAATAKSTFDEYEGVISSHGYHYGVLWGLETIAWDPALLLRVSLCLAKLAEIDPGGSDSNRPINSLRSIFLSWSPNTAATANQRMGILASVVRATPRIAWPLLEKLLPNSHDVAIPNQKPRFREYFQGEPELLTYGIVWKCQDHAIDLAIAAAGNDPERWASVIERLSDFPQQSLDPFLKALAQVMAKSSNPEGVKIWDLLRKELNHQRRYSDSDWTLKGDFLSRVGALVDEHAPSDPVLLAMWLFDDWIPDVSMSKEEDENDPLPSVETARKTAVLEVYKKKGAPGVVELARKSKLAGQVGATFGSLDLPMEQLLDVFEQMLVADTELDGAASVIFAEGTLRFQSSWVAATKKWMGNQPIEVARVAGLLSSLEETRANWAVVHGFGQEVEDAYWKQKHPVLVRGSEQDLLYAIENYMKRGRAVAALYALSNRISEISTTLLLDILERAIPDINDKSGTVTMNVYVMERALDVLREREDMSVEKVARLEFACLRIFRLRKKSPLLHKMMVTQPSFFMEVISTVFTSANGPAAELNDAQRNIASAAYGLLSSLDTLPGQVGNEVDEKELFAWCDEVRRLAAESDRVEIVDQRIGHLFAHAPDSPRDGVWPHESIRSAIEKFSSSWIETGVEIERFNMRGVYSKNIGEGGEQERTLAERSKKWADAMPMFPRTAAMLMRISASWKRAAEQEDVSAAIDALRF